ncbi:CAP domain-containing protein [uncultured Clostridium sp.]|uniref:CAP domain-containing protein n=1 Tax=uncultured Clostridium sp. TaxID=59620 RepID=UPI0025D162BD|nr:CAP domain-containing protein [uncultured Clostridium sp.]
MKKNKLLKILTVMSTFCVLALANPSIANAEWHKNDTGWWFSEGSSWKTGWSNINNNWYYFNSDGYMKTGWLNDSGNWYYLMPSGEMVSGIVSINGQYSHFDNSGKWTGYLNNPSYLDTVSENIISKEEFTQIVCSKMHELVNNHRKANGVKELKIDSNLDKSAYLKSKHMVDNNYFAHDYNGQSFSDLIYSLSGEKINGENIAQNYLSSNSYTKVNAEDLAQRLFIQWKNSAGHNENMLREKFTSFGFGCDIASNGYIYATQHFRIYY